jgi:hypothetical protein
MAFDAQYPGECAACGSRIHVGDQIEAAEDGEGWAHVSCSAKPAPEHPVCDVCWLTHPAGACDR